MQSTRNKYGRSKSSIMNASGVTFAIFLFHVTWNAAMVLNERRKKTKSFKMSHFIRRCSHLCVLPHAVVLFDLIGVVRQIAVHIDCISSTFRGKTGKNRRKNPLPKSRVGSVRSHKVNKSLYDAHQIKLNLFAIKSLQFCTCFHEFLIRMNRCRSYLKKKILWNFHAFLQSGASALIYCCFMA